MDFMKRGRLLLFVLPSVVFLLVSVSLVSAQDASSLAASVSGFIDNAVSVINPIASKILGETPGGSLLFAKVLFLIIILAIVWIALDRAGIFSDRPWILAIISIAVSILATRFLTMSEWINAIILPYSALGIAITALLPLLIYFYFVEKVIISRTLRKIAWIFAAVVFIGLYFTRLDELQKLVWIYPAAAASCIVFLFLDKTIQRAFKRSQAEATREVAESRRRAQVTKERAELEQQKLDGTITDADYRTQDQRLRKLERKYGLPVGG